MFWRNGTNHLTGDSNRWLNSIFSSDSSVLHFWRRSFAPSQTLEPEREKVWSNHGTTNCQPTKTLFNHSRGIDGNCEKHQENHEIVVPLMRQVHYGSLLLLHSAQLLEKHLDLHVRGKSWPAWRSCRHLWPHQQIIWWIGLERHQNKKRDGNSMEALKALASMTQVFGITNSRGGSCRALPPAKHRIHAKHSSHLASCWLLNWKTLRLRHWHPLLSQHWVNTHNQKKNEEPSLRHSSSRSSTTWTRNVQNQTYPTSKMKFTLMF